MIVKAAGEVEKFKFTNEITEENIKTFISDWENNKLTQHIKTDDIPATNDEAVKILVG